MDKKIIFNEFFYKYKEKACFNDNQVTIGKKGINRIDNVRHNINNHKKIKNNCLIIRIGIDDICVNTTLNNICCSPIYNTYIIKNIDPHIC